MNVPFIWRTPASAFFTFAFPLMFLAIFTSPLGHYAVRIGERSVDTATYYVASMACSATITACFNNIAMTVTFQREEGILKRASMQADFVGTPFNWNDVLVVLAWGAGRPARRHRFFTWEPRQGDEGPSAPCGRRRTAIS